MADRQYEYYINQIREERGGAQDVEATGRSSSLSELCAKTRLRGNPTDLKLGERTSTCEFYLSNYRWGSHRFEGCNYVKRDSK